MKTKKLIAFLLTAILMLSIPFSCFAKPVETNKNTEFGTLTGRLEQPVDPSDRKSVTYSTGTTKTAPTIIASMDVKLYTTGKQISSGETAKSYNSKKTGDQWECHSATYNKQKMSAFGCHEARGKSSLVAYTTLINF